MKILLTTATPMELSLLTFKGVGHTIIARDTGIGMLASSYHLLNLIRLHQPEMVIQAGIAGTFSQDIRLGDAVVVDNELVADMGVWENGNYLDIFSLGLSSPDAYPYENGGLKNPYLHLLLGSGMLQVTGVTVNEITTDPKKIEILAHTYAADIESMEGAALHYVCLMEQIPFMQIRGISNRIGERDKSKWEIKAAMDSISRGLNTFLNYISNT